MRTESRKKSHQHFFLNPFQINTLLFYRCYIRFICACVWAHRQGVKVCIWMHIWNMQTKIRLENEIYLKLSKIQSLFFLVGRKEDGEVACEICGKNSTQRKTADESVFQTFYTQFLLELRRKGFFCLCCLCAVVSFFLVSSEVRVPGPQQIKKFWHWINSVDSKILHTHARTHTMLW